MPDAYGKLIESYIQVLLAKLRFHGKYSGFPGTLSVGDDDLEKMGENDPNQYFEMAVDILDYLEAIVNMQTAGQSGAGRALGDKCESHAIPFTLKQLEITESHYCGHWTVNGGAPCRLRACCLPAVRFVF